MPNMLMIRLIIFSLTYLIYCAKSELWLPFLLHAQLSEIEHDDVIRIIKEHAPVSGLSTRLHLAALSVKYSQGGPGLGDFNSLFQITNELHALQDSESVWDIIFKADYQSNAFEFILLKAVQHKSSLLASMALVAKEAVVVVAASVWLSLVHPGLLKLYNIQEPALMSPGDAASFVRYSIMHLLKTRKSKILYVSHPFYYYF